ncbi:KLH10 protein, partial [Bucorvus abyssinicus]|nr:KLH10 protein [Bucorvus abyssinicus]
TGDSLMTPQQSSAHMEKNSSPMSCSVFNELRLEGELCDAVISVDGAEFVAHKVILCGCSNYFRILFSSRWNNTEKRVYKITGTSPEMMQLIINYAYTGTAPLTAANVGALLTAADHFHVMGIVRLCCEFLKSQLSLENCIGIWKLTDTYYCPELREAACLFILHHFQELSRVSAEFLELPVSDLKNIIEKDELNVREEGAVFEAVLKWIAHNPQSRRQHTADLLSRVRLALMPVEFLLNAIKTHKYAQDKECEVLILNALAQAYHLMMHGPASAFANPLSRPRLPSAILFAIGGWSGENATNAMETYDVRTDQWVDVTCEQEAPLAYHGTAYLRGFIYVIGGFDGMRSCSSVKRFDPLQRTWQEVAPMHSQRYYVSVAILDDHIYAMGGFDQHRRLNTAERYEPERNQWTRIASMQEQRSDASATSLQGKVYICGGFDGHERLITAEVYTTTTNQWTFIAPMGSRRSGAGVIAYDNEVFVVGGYDGRRRLQSVEAYNPMTNTWRRLPTMLSPRSNFGIAVVEDLLFVMGGFNGFTTTFTVEHYNRKTNQWYSMCDMGTHRSALSSTVVPDLPIVQEYTARWH